MDVHAIYLQTRPEDIAYIKFVFESYEGVGIIRTMDRVKAVIVVLVVTDFQDTARAIVNSLGKEISLTEVPCPLGLGDDWLLRELAVEQDSDL